MQDAGIKMSKACLVICKQLIFLLERGWLQTAFNYYATQAISPPRKTSSSLHLLTVLSSRYMVLDRKSIPIVAYKGKKIRVFLSEDYEFLCRIYGLSGASGTHKPLTGLGCHCCLWYLIKQLFHPVCDSVSLRTICDDHQKFTSAGSVHRNVKNFNNCLHAPFPPNFPLTQVLPVYHIAMIVTQKNSSK